MIYVEQNTRFSIAKKQGGASILNTKGHKEQQFSHYVLWFRVQSVESGVSCILSNCARTEHLLLISLVILIPSYLAFIELQELRDCVKLSKYRKALE